MSLLIGNLKKWSLLLPCGKLCRSGAQDKLWEVWYQLSFSTYIFQILWHFERKCVRCHNLAVIQYLIKIVEEEYNSTAYVPCQCLRTHIAKETLLNNTSNYTFWNIYYKTWKAWEKQCSLKAHGYRIKGTEPINEEAKRHFFFF